VGLGQTDTPVASGAGSPASPLANTVTPPTVTIGNEPAPLSFSGLAPGLVGVYQINLQIPADAPNGDLTLIVSLDGNSSNSGLLPVHN
jgi:uncharacterized protein (TIGR03437 family)